MQSAMLILPFYFVGICVGLHCHYQTLYEPKSLVKLEQKGHDIKFTFYSRKHECSLWFHTSSNVRVAFFSKKKVKLFLPAHGRKTNFIAALVHANVKTKAQHYSRLLFAEIWYFQQKLPAKHAYLTQTSVMTTHKSNTCSVYVL